MNVSDDIEDDINIYGFRYSIGEGGFIELVAWLIHFINHYSVATSEFFDQAWLFANRKDPGSVDTIAPRLGR